MSWTECFPVLTEEMVEKYEAGATPEERAEHEDWFSVKRIINRRKTAHTVAFSLFWRQAHQDDGELPALDRETLMKANEKGLVKRFAPWEHYVEPLLEGAARLRETRPDVACRVYLAADLEFLISDLSEAGCEVYLMKTSSIRHNPGAMWRFLALEERRKLVTISDSDRAPLIEADIQRTELMSKIGLGFWRVPVWGELNDKGMMAYRPILGCQFGSARGIRVNTLMRALIWHTVKGTISTTCRPPGCGELTVYGSKWPDYGFDEWFLQTALYPRIAKTGVLSFIPANARSRLLPLDIEYCTWSNSRSEIVYFGSIGGCCGPAIGPVVSTVNTAPGETSWLNWSPYKAAFSGMGDRLRGMATMAAAARLRGQTLRVYWPVSEHCPGRFSEILTAAGFHVVEDEMQWANLTENNPVLESQPYWIPADHAWEEGSAEGWLDRSAVSFSDFVKLRRRILNALIPSDAIARMLNTQLQGWSNLRVLGIHIRRTDANMDRLQGGEAGYDQALERRLIKAYGKEGWRTAFLCSDDLATETRWIDWLKERGWTVHTAPKNWQSGELRQTSLQEAFLDLKLLSHCDKIIGSVRSNFSEVASDMGGILVEVLGKTEPEHKSDVKTPKN